MKALDKAKQPKSKNYERFKTFIYKNSIPKDNEEGACIDSDMVYIFVKQIMISYEAELEELQNLSCESCKECMYLGVDTDICLKCSHSYASKFKRINNELQNK